MVNQAAPTAARYSRCETRPRSKALPSAAGALAAPQAQLGGRTPASLVVLLLNVRAALRTGWVGLAAMALACGGPDPATAAAGGAADAAVADGGLVGDGDGAAGDSSAGPDGAPDTARAAPKPVQPFSGPPAGQFDCQALASATKGLPAKRLATAPLGCALDAKCPARLVVGHRGAGGEFARIAPENSLAAIRAAAWMGYDGVELDVRHTADGALVLMHDGSAARTTGVSKDVSAMTLAEVTALPLLTQWGTEKAEVYPGDHGCERVPTLAAALELVRDRLIVDLDTKTDRIDLVVAAIAKAGLYDQVFVSVSDPKRAAEARALDPKIRVQIRPDTQAEWDQAMLLFPKVAPEIVEVDPKVLSALAPQVAKLGSATFVNGFNVDVGVVAQVLNGEPATGKEWLALYDQGARIVQTEFPGALIVAVGRGQGGN